MTKKGKRFLSILLTGMMVLGVLTPSISEAKSNEVHITILGTTDVHGHIYNWSYENERETEGGLARIATIVEEVRKENPNTLLLDNGDTIQGTILTDDLYNLNPEKKNPMMDVMNEMGYDAMTLGNHEFNFGLDMIKKLEKEAKFPILAANMYKEDGSHFVKPYTIVEKDGVKIGIIGLTHWNIHQWDGPKVQGIDFKKAKEELPKYIKELKEDEKVDIVIASVHETFKLESEDKEELQLMEAIAENKELAAVLVGHDHSTINEKIGNTIVGGARSEGREVVRMDLYLDKKDGKWEVSNSELEVITTKDYEPSKEILDHAKTYHEKTLEFIEVPIGKSTGLFHPESEVKGIPEAQLRDTALIDLVNKVQMKYAEADISGASLFDMKSNIGEGDISYKDLFSVYRYANTLVGVEMTGKQFKEYMEWTAQYYNQYEDGDVTISFKAGMRPYNYDMFMGVDYEVDISKPVGERIIGLTRNGKPIADDEVLKVAVNSHKFGVLVKEGFITEEDSYYTSDPASLRSLIAEYVKEEGTISPDVDNNWKVIGADLDHPLRDWIINEVNEGRLEIPTVDERSYNAVSLNVYELIKEGKIPTEVLKEHGLGEDGKPLVEEKPEVKPETKPEPKPEAKPETGSKYTVKYGDVLWKIARKYSKTWEELSKFNGLKNPHLIYPGQTLNIPK